MNLFDVLDDLQQLFVIVAADDGFEPLANGGAVGWHHRNADVIGAGDLTSAGGNGAGHAGQMRPAGEEVLDGDPGGMSPASRLDLNALLGLDRLMEAVSPRPALGNPAGELVDNDNLLAGSVFFLPDHILPVADEGDASPQGQFNGVVELQHADRIDQPRPFSGPHEAAANPKEFRRSLLWVVFVMNILGQVFGEITGEVEDGGLPLFAFACLAVG